MNTLHLTDPQVHVAVTALQAYLAETQSYLRGMAPIRGHDDCCSYAQRRNEELAQQRAAMEEREANTRAAIVALGGEAW
jgi:hypothetical protein